MARRRTENRLQKMLRSDGALCVTFVNTGLGRRRALDSYRDLPAWGLETGALDSTDAARLERAANERPGLAAGVTKRAKTLRARLERILGALAVGRRPAGYDVEAFDLELGAALGRRRLAATAAGGFEWSWTEAGDEDLDRMLWPVLLSAAELLVSGDRRRLRRCPSENCGLLFVARGGGRPRKWCGAGCRDRNTSRRHYRKVVKPKRERQAREKDARQKGRLAGYDESWQPPEAPD